jgi:arsenate reductase
MAEGFIRALAGDGFHAVSAGTEARDINPLAAEVMGEVGIDISTQKPNTVAAIFRNTFHFVVALCDESRERYPLFPFTGKLLRWSVADPEAETGGAAEKKEAFRRVRDQLRNRVEELVRTHQPAIAAVRGAAA